MIALIALINYLFEMAFGVNFQYVMGYLFYPIAWILGIPGGEALQAGSIMATKLVTNEFVAMMDLGKIAAELSPRTVGILSIFMVSFANFSSIGMQIGGIGGLAPNRRQDLARLGLRAMFAGTLANFMTACIAGMLL